jgi:predicted O-linked N-acetylglucosamine transferase (SPINDLY family)
MLSNDPGKLFAEALYDHVNGRTQEAFNKYEKILVSHPAHSETLHHIGLIYLQAGDTAQAIQKINKSLEFDPKNSNALSNLGYCFNTLGKFKASIDCCNKALQIAPSNDGAWTNLGNAQRGCNLWGEAQDSYQKALNLRPNNPRYIYNLANVYYDQEDFHRASNLFKQCLAIENRIPEAQNNLSACLIKLKDPASALLYVNASIELKPDYAEAWSNRGNALSDLKRHEEALASYERSIELKPDYAEAWSNRGNALSDLKRHEESATSFFKAASLKKQMDFDFGRAHHQMMLSCNWTDYASHTQTIHEGVEKGKFVGEPFGYQGIAESEDLLKTCAEIYCNQRFPTKLSSFSFNRPRKSRIKIGYLCGEFRDQATSHLMTGIWEHHDSSKFELFGLDNGWGDDSDYRKRIKIAFPNFFDISRLSDFDAARLINENEIDILVNLNGYFGQARLGVFSLKPTPISINYLGFPGTIGASYIDYLIADEIVIPKGSIEFYKEKVIYLPFSYQANDDRRVISNRTFTRSDFRLPENHFIFCCFNNNYKITPLMFATWMEILRSVSDSSLWILEDNNAAKKNLIAEAIKYSVNPDRLIFSDRITASEHLSRQKLADLFLDTLPYNAHTTASDALWTGLPLLTLKGKTFPGRVGASLLNAIGLPELVTYSYEEYANAAIALAKNPTKLAAIRAKLSQNRLDTPLFDTKLFARHIESAYKAAYDRYHAGLLPDHINVDP